MKQPLESITKLMPFGADDVSRKLSKLVCNIEDFAAQRRCTSQVTALVHLTAHPTDKSLAERVLPLITLTSLPPCGSAAVLTGGNGHTKSRQRSTRSTIC